MIKFLKKVFFSANISETGICHICERVIPDNDLKEIDDLFLCFSDYEYYKSHEWKLVSKGQSDPDNPEQALEIQNSKDLLKKQNIKSFIKVSYQEDNSKIITNFYLYQESSEDPQDSNSSFK